MMSISTERHDNYRYVNLAREDTTNARKIKVRIHRLVASVFLENPDNLPTVDHINRNREDNHVSNLCWATHSEQNQNQDYSNRSNIADRVRVQQIDPNTGEVVNEYESMTAAAEAVGGTKSSISAACRNPTKIIYGYRWRKSNGASARTGTLEASAAPSTSSSINSHEEEKELELISNINRLQLDDEDPEEWRNIVTKTGETITSHMISNRGRIRSIERPDIIRLGAKDRDAYRFELKQNGKKRTFGVHDLVASTFLGLPSDPRMDIWHKNRTRTDNRVSNLEWVTKKEFKLRLEYNNARRIQATYSDGRVEIYNSIGRAAEGTSIAASTISQIVNGIIPQRSDIRFEAVDL
jgi:hypothetical protein